MGTLRSRTTGGPWLAGVVWLGLAAAAGAAGAEPPREAARAAAAATESSAAASASAGAATSAPTSAAGAASCAAWFSFFHPPELPASALFAPLVRQEQPYSCGPAALASVLRYFHVWNDGEQRLYQPLGTSPQDGTLPENLAEVARSFGLLASVEQPMSIAALREALREGKLVILELQAWPSPGAPAVPWSSRWDDGHYVVLIALDDQYAYFMDPSVGDGYTYLELDELGPRWHDINPGRGEPLAPHDYQLGVVIGRPTPGRLAAPAAWPRSRPLHKLE